MNSKQRYDAPETEVIRIKIESNLLQVSNPTGNVDDPGDDGNS